jgi:hypothetical protein
MPVAASEKRAWYVECMLSRYVPHGRSLQCPFAITKRTLLQSTGAAEIAPSTYFFSSNRQFVTPGGRRVLPRESTTIYPYYTVAAGNVKYFPMANENNNTILRPWEQFQCDVIRDYVDSGKIARKSAVMKRLDICYRTGFSTLEK